MNTTCNIFGTSECTSLQKCKCKPGYTGEYCQNCDYIYNYLAIDGLESTIDFENGNGVKCTSKYISNKLLFIDVCTK